MLGMEVGEGKSAQSRRRLIWKRAIVTPYTIERSGERERVRRGKRRSKGGREGDGRGEDAHGKRICLKSSKHGRRQEKAGRRSREE